MSEGLEDLFVQILNSEQKAQERKTLLNEIKQKVSECLVDIEEAVEEQKSLQGQLVTEIQRWNDVELDQKCISSRESIFSSNIEDARQKLKENKRRLEELRSFRDAAHDDFCRDVEEFTLCFDLSNQSNGRWSNKMEKEVEKLKATRENLQGQIVDFERHLASGNALQSSLDSAKKQLNKTELQLSEIKKSFLSEGKSTRMIEKQREEVSEIPNTSREFKRLRAELQQCKEDTLEDYCASLQLQMQDLRQKLWQGNLKAPVEAERSNAKRFTNFANIKHNPSDDSTRGKPRPNLGRLSAAVKRNHDQCMNQNLNVASKTNAPRRN